MVQRLATLTRIATVMSACLIVSACGSDGADSGDAASPSGSSAEGGREIKTVTYVNPLPVYPGFNIIGDCFKKEAERLAYEPVLVGTSGSAVDNQGAINLIEQAIVQDTDALLAFVTETELFTPVIQKARAEGIYVGGIASGDKSTGQNFLTGTVWAAAGATVADAVGPRNPDARVGFLSVSPTAAVQSEAIRGFKERAAEKFPNMEMVQTVYDDGDPTKDVEVVGNMLAANPEIDLLFLVPGNTAGGLTAVRERGLAGKIDVISGDLTDDHRAAIESGEMYGVTIQDWCGIGESAVRMFGELAAGEEVPFVNDTGVRFVTKENLPANGF